MSALKSLFRDMSQAPPQEAELLVYENKFLKQTIMSLRDELVTKDQEQETVLQDGLAKINRENDHLRSSLSYLREQLDQAKLNHEEEIQKQSQAKAQNETNLRKLVQTLRIQLEKSERNQEA